MFLGIDLGTSGVKAVLVGEDQEMVGQAGVPLQVSRPRPLFSEQDPEHWWRATLDAIAALKAEHPKALAAVRGIGLSGQMHGATLLDESDRVLRPAILWNDGRCGAECAELEKKVPESRRITGNLAMPGFTAPKLLWVAKHEPEVFRRVNKVLLPKDYVRLRLSGEYVSDMSDSAGTLWLDVARRDWSDTMLAATGLTRDHMPRLVEGSEPGGELRAELAAEWGMERRVVIAGGAGDNVADAAGVGTVVPARAFLSLATSGVYFVAHERFSPNPEQAVHAFCHRLPGTWHQMGVIPSAASCLSWVTRLTGVKSEAALLSEVEAMEHGADAVTFLPYLSGERTPHNNPRDARGYGIETIYQTLALADNLDAPANLFLGHEIMTPYGTLDDDAMKHESRQVFRRLNPSFTNIKEPVKNLSGGQHQSVAIARAIYFDTRILIMDEPTAALGPQETAMVADLIKQLKNEGIGIFLISHDLHDVFDLSDRVTVMKNGRLVGTRRTDKVTKDQVPGMIILGKLPEEKTSEEVPKFH